MFLISQESESQRIGLRHYGLEVAAALDQDLYSGWWCLTALVHRLPGRVPEEGPGRKEFCVRAMGLFLAALLIQQQRAECSEEVEVDHLDKWWVDVFSLEAMKTAARNWSHPPDTAWTGEGPDPRYRPYLGVERRLFPQTVSLIQCAVEEQNRLLNRANRWDAPVKGGPPRTDPGGPGLGTGGKLSAEDNDPPSG